MIAIDDQYDAWLMLAGRILLALVFLISGVHKAVWYEKVIDEFRRDRIPLIWLTLPGTILLHLVCSACLIVGFMTEWAALALAIFTLVATLKVHAYWRLPPEQQLGRSRIFAGNMAVMGGLLVLAAVGPGPIVMTP